MLRYEREVDRMDWKRYKAVHTGRWSRKLGAPRNLRRAVAAPVPVERVDHLLPVKPKRHLLKPWTWLRG